MKVKKLPSVDVLREHFNYDKDTGHITRKSNGSRAFKTDNGHGYLRGSFQSTEYLAHRVAWAIHHGYDAPEFIDHINMDRSDNRIANLRLASKSENMLNRGAQKNSASGLKGAYFNKRQKSWYSRIQLDGVDRFLGYFAGPEEAHEAYKVSSMDIHGEFSRSS